MLVLTRKPDETIRIGDDITITLLKTGRGRAKIGIEAPAHLRVLRSELAARDEAVSNLATGSADGLRSFAWDVVHEIGNRELGT
jgi:carbon storage regulator